MFDQSNEILRIPAPPSPDPKNEISVRVLYLQQLVNNR